MPTKKQTSQNSSVKYIVWGVIVCIAIYFFVETAFPSMRCSPHSQIATLQLIEAKMLLRCCQVTKQEYTHSQVSQEAQPDA